ncbi:MAG: hypothetical protein M1835_007827 [Candelina submexicana]|nr:MAG: hypothetical protein M1835_007827 [Candelina submexicana]
MSNTNATNQDGNIIIPHLDPQNVEFPFPGSYANPLVVSGQNPDTTGGRRKGPSQVPNTDNAPTPNGAASSEVLIENRESKAKPTEVRRAVTERPKVRPRGPTLRRGRTALNTAAWDAASSDSDSLNSSSSEDDDPLPKLSRANTHGSKHSIRNPLAANTKKQSGRRESSSAPYSRFKVGNEGFKTQGKVSKTSGRLNISVNETLNRGYLAKALGSTLKGHLGQHHDDEGQPMASVREEDSRPGVSRGLTGWTASSAEARLDALPVPTLNVVVMVIGSRGDIQPFLKVGKELKAEGHRVRIATHPAFKKFVEQDSGLEFFSVGGNPSELMAFMVKNPGLIPSIETVRAGEIGRRRDQMFEMFQGFWRACINATDDEKNTSNRKMMEDKHPFVADAIIANPPSFAHIHCAERLGIPLHLMFTFPYSPTQAFPHPLANIKKSNVDANYTNFMSYPLVEMMTWQGLGDLVNRFRVKTLGLEPVSTLWAPGQLFRLKVPYTYLWSPGLIPKPKDWGPEIDIAGFVFLDLASNFNPPAELTKFLEAGPPPVYIGFGSIVVDDPDQFTSLIFAAVEKAGVRALVSKGWGGLGDEGNTPDNIFMLENTPHDWLFPRVSAVVHHGGAGTTAIGLKCGKPTMIVPFFGDQPFWGAMVAKAGAGCHEAVPYKRLTADRLAEGITECLSLEAQKNAEQLATDIAKEGDGAKNAVDAFHRNLPLRGQNSMRCSILGERVAVWSLKANSNIHLSALAAEILVQERKIRWKDLRLLRHYEWNDFEGPGEPLTGAGAAIVGSVTGVAKGFAGVPMRWAKAVKRREKHDEKQRRKSRAKQPKSTGNGNTANGLLGKESGIAGGTPFDGTNQNARDAKKATTKDSTHDKPNGTALEHDPFHDVDDADSDLSDMENENIAEDIATETGKGLTKSGEAIAKAPLDLSLAIAQGFHNAPRLYGDSTVRRPVRVSGMHSGLHAAGHEFVYGIYDGWTGLVMHPYKGARAEGCVGLVKGVGKGFGGFVLKDLAAIFGPFAYTLKGVHKEIQRSRQPTAYIQRARIHQGEKDIEALSRKDLTTSSDEINSGSERDRVFAEVDRGWNIVLDLGRVIETKKKEGLIGRMDIRREGKRWKREGAFENVEKADRALKARRKGIAVERVLRKKKAEDSEKHGGNGVNAQVKNGDRQVSGNGHVH